MFIWCVLTYGCESWTGGKIERDKLRVMKMWIQRRMTTTRWKVNKSRDKRQEACNEKHGKKGI